MVMNRIQFQHGMSLPEFATSFGSEAQCSAAFKQARWPEGFRCPRCGGAAHYVVGQGTRQRYQCAACRHQASLIAGTLLASTKLPLTTWFLAMYLLSQAKTGLSALALKRQLGVSYPTAWLLHHKIMQAMTERDGVHRLGGTVQLDDAYLGGERSGGKVGRGSENKVPFVAAVSLDAQGHPAYLKLTPLPSFTREAVGQWARTALRPGSCVVSDGLGCFAAVSAAGCTHVPLVAGGRKPRELPEFAWVNTVLGNLKMTLSGAFHAFKYPKYARSYLGAFAYRFNRRFDLRGLLARLITDTVQCKPRPQRVIRGNAEDHC
ncbi:MAG: IS1595 family transposase [Leptothrix sp. (in: b-proteobacteria)]